MSRIIRLIITILVLSANFNALTGSAQTTSDIWNVPRTGGETITEPSPEATAMRRYKDCPVSFATGTADISIPLIDLVSRDLEISLGLSYHTGGIKKSDIATGIGLGWTLTGLGSVSRQINGFPDEWRGGGNDVKFDFRTTSGVTVDYLRSIIEAKTDAQYDCYSYNFGGYSGTFYIVNGSVVEYPASDLKISFVKDGNEIGEFTIATPEGRLYTFKEKEYIEAKSYSTAISQPLINRDYTAISQWNLTKIESLATKESISIAYSPRQEWTRIADKMLSGYSFNYTVGINSLVDSNETTPGGLNLDERTTFRNHSLPSVIYTGNGFIEFSSRSVANYTYIDAPADYLSSIHLKDLSGKTIKEVTIHNSETFLDKRQKLTGVDILTDGVLTDRYRFGYNDLTGAPGEDFFGYPNGKGTELSFDYSAINSDLTLSLSRSSDKTFLADNCLTEINSITGLKTTITYEPASVTVAPKYNESVFSGDITVGLRIKSIEVTDRITGRSRKRSYSYQGAVCSVPLEDLKYGDFISQSGTHTFYNYGDALHPTTYSMGVTFPSSATLKGMGVESARLYYSKVSENLTGTDINHAIVTEFEYDLTDITSTLMAVGKTISYGQIYFGNNPEDAKSLTSFHDIIAGMTQTERQIKEYHPSRGYLSQTLGGGPLLKRRTEKEWTSTGYRIVSTEESYYSKTDHKRFANALYCESAVFRYNFVNGVGTTLNITDFNDMNYFWTEISSYRVVCDSTVKTTFYPGGESRRVKTGYIYSANSAKGGCFPGFYTDSIRANSGISFTPLGVIVSSGDEAIETYTAMTENVDTERNFNIMMAGMRKLPAIEKWVTRTPGGCDSVLRQTDYNFFGSKRIIRPERVIVTTAQSAAGPRSLISEQRYTAYDNHGHITAMTDAKGRTIAAEWDADYDQLTKMTLTAAGLSTTYTYRPLIGCTSITAPSGKKRQFSYTGGRLTAEKNTAGENVAAYQYELYGEDQSGNGRNLITSTVYDDSGEASEATLYDGFGMPVRKLSTVAGGSQVCVLNRYDALDRQVREYLPVPSSSIDAAPDASSYYSDAFSYKSISYRALAADQPLDIIAEGQIMQTHPTIYEYLCNNIKDPILRCPRYQLGKSVSAETITSAGNYPAGTLDVTRTTDPDGHISLIFTDWRGLKILERRVIGSSDFADTYYLYDALGRQRVVIQPEGIAAMASSGGSWDNNSEPLAKMAFIYRYDTRGNLIYSLVPGGGGDRMIYDVFNRPAFRATAAMTDEGRTEYYLYDRIDRPVVTGLLDIDISGISATYDMRASLLPSAAGIDGSGYMPDDNTLSNLLAESTVTTANYYDSYSMLSAAGFKSLPANIISQKKAVGLLTAQRQAVYSYNSAGRDIGTGYHYSLIAYDSEERVTTTLSSAVISDEYSLTTTAYTRQGHPSEEDTKVVFSDKDIRLHLVRRYDPLGNLLGASASMTDAAGNYGRREQSKIDYQYDALGRICRSALLPTASAYCTYSYDMRGRFNGINSPGFSQRLYFEDGTSPVFNGSISAAQFGYVTDRTTGMASLSNKVTYRYDLLGRLTSTTSNDGYSTNYTYDRNSAPVSILRSGLISDGVSIGLIDDLRLQYDGNRPVNVTDRADRVVLESSLDFDSPTGRSVYRYDSSGRLIADSGSEINLIKYAPNDMPVLVQTPKTTILYSYRADGAKLMSVVSNLGTTLPSVQTRYDIGPFRFIRSLGGQLQIDRINLPWGYIDNRGLPNVYIKDHQGNVRAVYNQHSGAVTQQTDYYPYGLPKAKSTNAEANPFKYIGKELSTDLTNPFYDFEARMQLPTLSIFNRPDPKAGKTPSINTYSYCGGDPVNRVDFDGNEVRCLSSDTKLQEHAERYKDNKNNIIVFMHGRNDKEGRYVVKDTTKPIMAISSGSVLKHELDVEFESIDPTSNATLFIELHSCYAGQNAIDGGEPLAQKFSKEIPNAIIMAPNGKLFYGEIGNEVVACNDMWEDGKTVSYDKLEVQWRYFFNGKEISSDAANLSQTLFNRKESFLVPIILNILYPDKEK